MTTLAAHFPTMTWVRPRLLELKLAMFSVLLGAMVPPVPAMPQ
jgi:hypothetical protein